MPVDIDDLESIGMGPACPKCGNETDWLRCWNCGGEGFHELYDQDPLWYDEDDTEPCDVCEGEGGWWRCSNCKECFDRVDFPVDCKHDWEEHYYGLKCRLCEKIAFNGDGPWTPLPDSS